MSGPPSSNTTTPIVFGGYSIDLKWDSGLLTHVIMAPPGTSTDQSLWQVFEITWDTELPRTIRYASGSDSFNQVNDDYASLTYS